MTDTPEVVQTASLAIEGYDLLQVFKAIQALGYNISKISLSESVQDDEDDVKILTVSFNVSGLPVPAADDGSTDVGISIGQADVHIFAAELNDGNDRYYVEDVVMSDFIVDGDIRTYKSFAIEAMFHALLKTFIIVHQETENKA